MNRRCPACQSILDWNAGDEAAARDNAGNATEKDTFVCRGCPRLYRHVVRERFSGNTEWWGIKDSASEQDWRDLDAKSWPKLD